MGILRCTINFISGGVLDRRDAKKMIQRASRDFDNAVEEFKESQDELSQELVNYRKKKLSIYNEQLKFITDYLRFFRELTFKQRMGIEHEKRTLASEEKQGRIEDRLKLSKSTAEEVLRTILGFVPILKIGAYLEAKEHLENTTVEVAKIDMETESIRLLSSTCRQGREIILLTEKTVEYLVENIDRLLPLIRVTYKRLCHFGKLSELFYRIMPAFWVKKQLKPNERIVITNALNTAILIAMIFKSVNVIKEDNSIDLSAAGFIKPFSKKLGVNAWDYSNTRTLLPPDKLDMDIENLKRYSLGE